LGNERDLEGISRSGEHADGPPGARVLVRSKGKGGKGNLVEERGQKKEKNLTSS